MRRPTPQNTDQAIAAFLADHQLTPIKAEQKRPKLVHIAFSFDSKANIYWLRSNAAVLILHKFGYVYRIVCFKDTEIVADYEGIPQADLLYTKYWSRLDGKYVCTVPGNPQSWTIIGHLDDLPKAVVDAPWLIVEIGFKLN